MSKAAEKIDLELWEAVKREITSGDRGGEPGEWSASKAQLAMQEYEKRLAIEARPAPDFARIAADIRALGGHPILKAAKKKSSLAAKLHARTRDELMTEARVLDIPGRSSMTKSELAEAVRLAKH